MRVLNCRQYFLDSMVELVGVRSGLSISNSDLVRLLTESGHERRAAFWPGDPGEVVSIQAGDFQEDFGALLYAVGVVRDPRPLEAFVREFATRHVDAFPDSVDLWPFPKVVNVAQEVNQVVIEHVSTGSDLPELFATLPGIDDLIRNVGVRHIWGALPESRPWNGTLNLAELFDSEVPLGSEGTYFDQRFIDYLVAQPLDLQRIHWRKFEQLTAEYFRRVGYEVKLGPGRDDGGVDILAERREDVVGPSLIVVQCRRYGDSNPVGLDAIRAFWATVGDTAATRGLVATTSRLTQGARDYCNARRYRLSAAEGTHVKEWLGAMASIAARQGP